MALHSMDLSLSRVEQSINEAIAAELISLPTLPEVALQVKQVAANPDCTIDDLVRCISSDASVSARILKVANSPAMRNNESGVSDLRTAVTNMGVKYTSNLAVGVAMAQMFSSDHQEINSRLKDTWALSAEIAGLCQAFCKFNGHLDASVGLLAGLIHRIGVLPVLAFAEEHPWLANDLELVDRAIEQLHPQIGGRVLRAWGFEQTLIDVCEQYLTFDRDVENADYADIVSVAILENFSGTEHPLGQVDHETVKAYARLGMNPESGGIGTVELSGTASDAAWALN